LLGAWLICFKSFVVRKIHFLILCYLVDVLVACALLEYLMIANRLVELFFWFLLPE